MKELLKNPYIIVVICMVLYAVMYNNATNGFMRVLSHVPLLVIIGILIKGLAQAFKR